MASRDFLRFRCCDLHCEGSKLFYKSGMRKNPDTICDLKARNTSNYALPHRYGVPMPRFVVKGSWSDGTDTLRKQRQLRIEREFAWTAIHNNFLLGRRFS
jgi:hypothetical protein